MNKITDVYIVVALDEDGKGGEGIPAIDMGGMPYPLFCTNLKTSSNLELFKDIVARSKTDPEMKRMELRHFKGPFEVIETHNKT